MALPRLTIATPCATDWEGMKGDARVRRCSSCDKDVYSTKALTRAELERLITEREGPLPCMRIYRRPDGTVVTRDCLGPLQRAAGWLRLKATVAASLMLGLLPSFGGGLAHGAEPTAATPSRAGSAEPAPRGQKGQADKPRKKKPKKAPEPPAPAPPGRRRHDVIDQGLPLLEE
ncbi:MAG TPA: hypothetical protein VKZ18_19970 [Polyangia bacterium]|nr:hypothetical protein [Polyangia bacterium]